ncbi:MAG: hypothetical protein AAGU78_08900 [Chloroflexota bacterium]|nr:hypothetical protein [Anaerolineae bacterium]
MEDILLAPPIAFGIYLALTGVLSGFGRMLAGPVGEPSETKVSTYASGEAAPARPAAPGYRQFFTIALFFAIVHLGVLMLGSSDLSAVAAAFLVGLILALLALILG